MADEQWMGGWTSVRIDGEWMYLWMDGWVDEQMNDR
jgi:hypothetical protein